MRVLPNTKRAIICGPSNCDETNDLLSSYKLAREFEQRTFRICVSLFEIVAIAKISISRKFVRLSTKSAILCSSQQ